MRLLIFLTLLAIFGVMASAMGTAGIYAYYAKDLPDPTTLDERRVFQTARILDRNGQVLGEFSDPKGGNRTLIPISEMPQVLRDATVSAEDASFYTNPGFDPRAIVRALWQNFREQSITSGASTITQQLVKNTLLSPDPTADRKIKEALLAIELTRRYSKDKILEMYLNEIYYGNNAYGIEAAAQTYFGKRARELTLTEASFLAGLPQAPSWYDPYTNLAGARERQTYVLEQMARNGFVTAEQAESAQKEALPLKTLAQRTEQSAMKAPHFVNFVRAQIERQYGSDTFFRSGMQVKTSLDLKLQALAEQQVKASIQELRERNATNASLVSLAPASGEILAMVGSVDFNDASIGGQVNVALAARQPGSTLKPFTYLTAFATKGWTPASVIWDVPTTFGGNYTPLNFDRKFRGPVSVRSALGNSLNVPAVKALETVGLNELLTTVHRMGISSLRDPARMGLAVTLGGGEVSLLDLTFAYQGFANDGIQNGIAIEKPELGYRIYDPVSILSVTDSTGRTLFEHRADRGREVVNPSLAYLITHMLSDDDARAETFGRNGPLSLGRSSAGKTGTTDDFRDSWVVGYTPDLLTGVWVGNNDGSPMRDVQGAAGAGRIYKAFMLDALGNVEARRFARPADVVEREVCAATGQLPGPNCQRRVTDVFLRANLPTEINDGVRAIEVCKVNGKLATEAVPAIGRETRMFSVIPPEALAWATQNGRVAPPTARCDDVYKGLKRAEISSPSGPMIFQTSVPIVGIAEIDDFDHYDLELGEGAAPSQWLALATGRTAAPADATLGSLNSLTVGQLRAGVYTLRLRVFDSLGNSADTSRQISIAVPAPSPTVRPPATVSPVPAIPAPATRAPTLPPVTSTPPPRLATPTPRRG
ncbi:MAG: PBP1A family penicillin-binding protein [Chloroflexota bacterium]